MMNINLTLFLAFLLIQTTSSQQQDECFTTSCDVESRDLFNLTQIRFPFRLAGIQPKHCGFPGFGLTCDNTSGKPILKLKHTSFSVQMIDYPNQQIWLSDPNRNTCLPRLLLTLDGDGLWDTPFEAVYIQQYTLYNCSRSNRPPPEFPPIDCLGGAGKNYTVVASGSRSESARLSRCNRIKTVAVPVPWPAQSGWIDKPNADIRLSWYRPWCGDCESKNGICRLKHDSGDNVECRIPGDLAKRLRLVITMALGIPSSIIIFVAICFSLKRCNSSIEIPPVVVSRPNTVLGLDQAAIESIPKTVLSESMGLDNTCPICLGEYKVKESIKTFPTCQHSFHSHCIDEWLHRNATCPVCRKYQKESPSVSLELSLLPEP